ncbi:MAG TPA: hypothetical protein VLG12_07095 [Candidatus Saccharimonadales bacterium]|nr:hypothetical protein [Candidatus Saccharimonadales bacterium]
MQNSFEYNKKSGYFLTARSIFHSELWRMKPAWWIKVTMYIIGNAQHEDYNDKIKRGDLFTKYSIIYRECNLVAEHIEEKAIKHLIEFLKKIGFCTTRKTTRGLIITIINYDQYQTISNYSSLNKAPQQGTSKEHRSPTINKTLKNEINNTQNSSNEKIVSCLEEIKSILGYWNELYGTHYKAPQALQANFSYWRQTYSIDEIKTAIKNISQHTFWADKMTPTLLFRIKGKNQESVQYIEDFLNLKLRDSNIFPLENSVNQKKMEEAWQE